MIEWIGLLMMGIAIYNLIRVEDITKNANKMRTWTDGLTTNLVLIENSSLLLAVLGILTVVFGAAT